MREKGLHRIGDDLAIAVGPRGTTFNLRAGRNWLDDAVDEVAFEFSLLLAKWAEFHRRYGP